VSAGVAVAIRTCLERRHSLLRRNFAAWRALFLVEYLRADDARGALDVEAAPGAFVEVRRCDCGAKLGVAFTPDVQALEALRRCPLSLLQLADLVGRGSREAGIVLCERDPGAPVTAAEAFAAFAGSCRFRAPLRFNVKEERPESRCRRSASGEPCSRATCAQALGQRWCEACGHREESHNLPGRAPGVCLVVMRDRERCGCRAVIS